MKKYRFRTVAAVASAFVLVFAIGVVAAWALSDAFVPDGNEPGGNEQDGSEPYNPRTVTIFLHEWESGDATSVYPVNENGQTYGGSAPEGYQGPRPDLILVRGGGYILKEDLYSVKPNPDWGTEGIIAYWDNHYHDAAVAFADHIKLQTGVELDVANVKEVLDNACNHFDDNGNFAVTYKPSVAYFEYRYPAGLTALLALMPEGYQTKEYVNDALGAAWAVSNVWLTVYAQDGVTVIGEWLCM